MKSKVKSNDGAALHLPASFAQPQQLSLFTQSTALAYSQVSIERLYCCHAVIACAEISMHALTCALLITCGPCRVPKRRSWACTNPTCSRYMNLNSARSLTQHIGVSPMAVHWAELILRTLIFRNGPTARNDRLSHCQLVQASTAC